MFGSKEQPDEPGLRRLQQEIARDRLRLQQRLSVLADQKTEEIPTGAAHGRLYQVFKAMGEA